MRPSTTIEECGKNQDVRSSANLPTGINMFGQFELGPAGKYSRVALPAGIKNETRLLQEKWFRECFEAITEINHKPILQGQTDGPSIKSIAFPHSIGCGLAGGNWNRYQAMLHNFARVNPFSRRRTGLPTDRPRVGEGQPVSNNCGNGRQQVRLLTRALATHHTIPQNALRETKSRNQTFE
eukprot:Selendium_serpulae@DN5621_c0_g2_i4.p1